MQRHKLPDPAALQGELREKLKQGGVTRKARRTSRAASGETISQILLAAALIAILMVGSGLTTGTTAFVMLLSCIGVGIFLVRRSLAQPPSNF